MEQRLSDQVGGPPAAAISDRFSVGVDDLVIMPLVAVAFVVRRILRRTVLRS